MLASLIVDFLLAAKAGSSEERFAGISDEVNTLMKPRRTFRPKWIGWNWTTRHSSRGTFQPNHLMASSSYLVFRSEDASNGSANFCLQDASGNWMSRSKWEIHEGYSRTNFSFPAVSRTLLESWISWRVKSLRPQKRKFTTVASRHGLKLP